MYPQNPSLLVFSASRMVHHHLKIHCLDSMHFVSLYLTDFFLPSDEVGVQLVERVSVLVGGLFFQLVISVMAGVGLQVSH